MPTIANMEKVNGIVISGAPAVSDAHTLIATATASASATLSFTLGLDSLYDAYEFRFENMHPQTDSQDFYFQVNAAGQTGFNEVMTTAGFRAYHGEDNSGNVLEYYAAHQANGTANQLIASATGSDADQACSGVLTLYAPSSTTYVKHFLARANAANPNQTSVENHTSGYINTTAAIDEISFKYSAGNIDAGQIKMYGIAKA